MMSTVYVGVQRVSAEDVCTPQQAPQLAAAHDKTHSTVFTSVSSRSLLPCPLFRLLLGALVSALLILLTIVVVRSLQSFQQTCREEERLCSSNTDNHLNSTTEFRHLKEFLKHLQEEMCSPQEQMICKLCPQNWVYNEEKCYYISQEKAPWDESRSHCTSRRSELVVIEKEGGKEFLVNQLATASFWIGLRNENGTWRWVTGSNFTDKINGGADAKGSCGTMNGGEVGSDPCKNPNKWICVKNATVIPPALELYN